VKKQMWLQLRSAHPLPVECVGDASPSSEDASPVTSSQVQINPVGLTGAYFRGPASPHSSARSHNHAPHVAGRAFNTRQSCELLALLARTNYFKWLSDVSNIFQQFRSAG